MEEYGYILYYFSCYNGLMYILELTFVSMCQKTTSTLRKISLPGTILNIFSLKNILRHHLYMESVE